MSLLPDLETLTVRASAPAYNLRQRKPYFNLPSPDWQNASVHFFKYHTVYTFSCCHTPPLPLSPKIPGASLLRIRPENSHALVGHKVQRNTLPHKENISLLQLSGFILGEFHLTTTLRNNH